MIIYAEFQILKITCVLTNKIKFISKPNALVIYNIGSHE